MEESVEVHRDKIGGFQIWEGRPLEIEYIEPGGEEDGRLQAGMGGRDTPRVNLEGEL